MAMKPHIKTLPCFPQVAAVIGESSAQIELWKVAHLRVFKNDYFKLKLFIGSRSIHAAIPYNSTQGWIFWSKIISGINPYHD